MKKIHPFICIAICVIAMSCVSDPVVPEQEKPNNQFSATDNPFYQLKGSDVFLNDPGKYLMMEFPTDYVVHLSSSRATPIDQRDFSQWSGLCPLLKPESRASLPEKSPYDIKINDRQITSQAESRSDQKEIDYSKFYGSTVKFSFDNAVSRSGGTTSVDMYIPTPIELLSPRIQSASDLYPLCYYDNMVLKWNADPRNENGIIVIVEWLGTMIYGFDHPDMYMRKVVRIEQDNGIATLSNDLFTDIPDSALCHLTIGRGNIEEVVVGGEYSYKIVGESRTSLPFILVRNISEN